MKVLAFLITAAAVTVVAAVPAYADSSGSPLTIKSCVVARGASAKAFGGAAAPTDIIFTDGVTIALTNTSSKPITSTVLSGSYDGMIITDTVKQTIAPGATVTWSKKHSPLVYNGPEASCKVDHVDFADGTSWTESSPYK